MVAFACGGPANATSPAWPPATGLVLLSLRDGTVRAHTTLGTDPVAVIVSDDGTAAYIADSSPGDVYAVSLPDLKALWTSHVGGAPFALLMHAGRLYVTLYDGGAIAELDPADGHLLATDTAPPHPAAIALDANGKVVVASGTAFGIALAGGTLWTADYSRSTVDSVTGDRHVQLPLPVHAFWLEAGGAGTLLIAAEGDNEDSDPGAVFSYDGMSGRLVTLARPRDPDKVVASGDSIFVPAHGDHEVLSIRDGVVSHWARGVAGVAVAPDPTLGLLVVAVNSHE